MKMKLSEESLSAVELAETHFDNGKGTQCQAFELV